VLSRWCSFTGAVEKGYGYLSMAVVTG